jgi:outer membrane protein, adhesin transport system
MISMLCSSLLTACMSTRGDPDASASNCSADNPAIAMLPQCTSAAAVVSQPLETPESAAAQPDRAGPERHPKEAPPSTAKSETTGSITRGDADVPRRAGQRPSLAVAIRANASLADAVAAAVLTFPEIGINQARVREAAAGVGIARSALFPTLDVRVAQGGNFSGNYEGRPLPYKTASNAIEGRFDGGLVLRQLLYDFGAAEADIDRARLLRDAEQQKLQEKVEEIAHRTSLTYLRIIEQRALLGLIDETIASHEQLARIVKAHAAEGHGTVADVQRVTSRLVDVRAIRTDISLQLLAAEDQLSRLTRQSIGKLTPVRDYAGSIPKTPSLAFERVVSRNPRLGALMATRRATQRELDSYQASIMPKFNLEIDTESKNFRSAQLGRTQSEGRVMVAMRYRIMDGGLSAATQEQIGARINGAEMSFISERDQLEADIRQAYRAIDSAKRKNALVSSGVDASRKVRELYLEQFKGGKRTIFELLDGQMSYYTIRRTQIESQFEGRRAVFDVLRATSDLTKVLSAAR